MHQQGSAEGVRAEGGTLAQGLGTCLGTQKREPARGGAGGVDAEGKPVLGCATVIQLSRQRAQCQSLLPVT